MGRRRPRRRGRAPRRPVRRVPAQHREPGPPVDRPLPPLRRRRDAAPDRLPRRPGQLPEPVRAHRRLPRRAGRGRVALDGHARRTRAVQAGRRLGRPRPHEGRVEHRRRRPQRPGPHELLAVRRPLRARSPHPRAPGQGRVGRPASRRPTGHLRPPQARRAHRRAARVRLRQGVALPASGCRQRGRRAACGRSTSSCPGPRLPHDMAFTEQYAILNDLPLFWDPDLLAQGVHLPRFFPDIPSRFAIVRRDGTGDVRWFEADPTYVLHWINAYEDGDEVVLDGFFQHDPSPRQARRRPVAHGVRLPVPRPRAAPGPPAPLAVQPRDRPDDRGVALRPHHGVRHDQRHRRRSAAPLHLQRHRRARAGSSSTGSSSTTCTPATRTATPSATASSGARHRSRRGPVRPRRTTATWSRSPRTSAAIAASASSSTPRDLAAGPIARVRLPERISAGTHSCWVPSAALPPPDPPLELGCETRRNDVLRTRVGRP